MGKHKSSFAEKAEWLSRRPELIDRWPVSKINTDKAIIAAMRKAGLISMKANDWDIQDLGKLIGEARSRYKRRQNKTYGFVGKRRVGSY